MELHELKPDSTEEDKNRNTEIQVAVIREAKGVSLTSSEKAKESLSASSEAERGNIS